ncbi:VanW family protein [Patescibacteria group bacterium]|nr:VanW family protein [Patescibacteria group bacterium]
METKKKSKYKGRIIFYLLMILIIIGGYFFVFQKIYALTVYPRVYCCDGLSLSGLKPKETGSLIKILVKKIERQGFPFYAQTDLGERKATLQSHLIALTDPDLSRQLVYFDVQGTLEKAFQVGRQGSFIQRIIKTLPGFTEDQVIDLIVKIDQVEFAQVLHENFKDLEKPAKNAQLLISNDNLILVDGEPGFILDYQTAVKDLENNLKAFKNGEIQIATLSKNPQIESENAEKAFSQAQDLFNSGPYQLIHQNKEWILPAKKIGQWFEFKKGGFGRTILGFNKKKIREYLQEIAKEIDVEPVKPQLEVDNDRVIEFQVSQPGQILNQEESAEIIIQTILDKNTKINLKVDKIEPASLPEDVDNLGIRELIGQGDSNFGGSPNNRRHNIKTGAQKLHGLLIKPDEEFSLLKAIGSVDKETGFLPELVIKGDRTVPEYGGGLCQLGTTMFRLAINAGLPITERSPHSYRVVYYEPAGMDATIYNPRPDLKFINDTGHHLLIQTEIKGDDLIFKFYGTSDGREVVTTQPKIFNITPAGPVQYIETTELAPGEKEKIESSHSGAEAEFKNTITFLNGVIRGEIWQSYYRPWPEVWLVGKEE